MHRRTWPLPASLTRVPSAPPTPLQNCIDPERELKCWEAIVATYELEAEKRGKMLKMARKRLFNVIVQIATHGPDPAKLKASSLACRKINYLERTCESFTTCGGIFPVAQWRNPKPTSQMPKRRRGKGKGKGKWR